MRLADKTKKDGAWSEATSKHLFGVGHAEIIAGICFIKRKKKKSFKNAI